ncbi:MAG: hypothetical protein HZB23_11600 [Deltaproteobacteria bacterium]|nr:hypothetical protein [Deltaproteobacteria bacterium]
MEEPGAKWRAYQESLKRPQKKTSGQKPETRGQKPEKGEPLRLVASARKRSVGRVRQVRSSIRGLSGDLGQARITAISWLSRQKEIRSPAVIIFAVAACLVVIGLVAAGLVALPGRGEMVPKLPHDGWNRSQARLLLGDAPVDTWTEPEKIRKDGRSFMVTTTLSQGLQERMREVINPRYARWIGFAAMDPFTGRIIAAAGFAAEGETEHPVFTHLYPAASIFKIVTATAAVDLESLQADTPVGYGGNKYTLYKNQIRPDSSAQTTQVALKEAFGGSINPAFGLIGAYVVGREKLEDMACAFGFGRRLDMEITTAPPVCPFPETGDDFGVAQIASGFNRTTLMTPINGAAFVAAILNDGVYLDPSIILGVTDGDGTLVYESVKKEVGRVCSSATAAEIRKMMGETITGGTARRLFSGYSRDPVLSRLDLGGKTGSINDGVVPNIRYDWFVGYGIAPSGNRALAVASVVAHEKFIGDRAAHYAREAFKFHFADLAQKAGTVP